jgi:hypothetical protein
MYSVHVSRSRVVFDDPPTAGGGCSFCSQQPSDKGGHRYRDSDQAPLLTAIAVFIGACESLFGSAAGCLPSLLHLYRHPYFRGPVKKR